MQYGRTPERFGFDPSEVEQAYDSVAALRNLHLVGLMTVAPLGLNSDEVRAIFRDLRERRDRLSLIGRERQPLELSMGMSDDFVVAIEEGATVVRIGRAIFAN